MQFELIGTNILRLQFERKIKQIYQRDQTLEYGHLSSAFLEKHFSGNLVNQACTGN
jgi:hypothetical protein